MKDENEKFKNVVDLTAKLLETVSGNDMVDCIFALTTAAGNIIRSVIQDENVRLSLVKDCSALLLDTVTTDDAVEVERRVLN